MNNEQIETALNTAARAVFKAGPSYEVRNDYPAPISKKAARADRTYYQTHAVLMLQVEADSLELSLV